MEIKLKFKVSIFENMLYNWLSWIAAKRNKFIDYDLETSPLLIKTNSALGSGDILRVYFYNANFTYAGAVGIKFDTIPQFYIRGCTDHVAFPTALPETLEKTWSFALIKSSESAGEQAEASGAVRLQIRCNGVEVLSFLISRKTCSDNNLMPYLRGDLSHVTKIWFFSGDTASNFYMSQSGPCQCSDINNENWSASVVEYTDTGLEVVPLTQTILRSKTITNGGSEQIRVKFAVSETVSEAMSFTRPAEVSIATNFTARVPFISLAGKVSTLTSAKHGFSFGEETVLEKPLSLEFECAGAAKTMTSCSVVKFIEQISMPYSMTWTQKDDPECSCEVEGTYRKVSVERVDVIVTESKLDE
ncbi:hypothetical protein ACHWQZ_G018833 [Mnemiopsis leidyi]